jgi:prevent-host-death family protein
MGKAISAATANRDYSKLLRDVRDGNSFVITNHGKPIAKIIPFIEHDVVRNTARQALLAQLRSQTAVDIGRWTRDELYEDD